MKLIVIPVVAIICVTLIACYALSQGINGVVLSSCLTIIGGAAGFGIGKQRAKSKPLNVQTLPKLPTEGEPE